MNEYTYSDMKIHMNTYKYRDFSKYIRWQITDDKYRLVYILLSGNATDQYYELFTTRYITSIYLHTFSNILESEKDERFIFIHLI
jgi:hypothetical protein